MPVEKHYGILYISQNLGGIFDGYLYIHIYKYIHLFASVCTCEWIMVWMLLLWIYIKVSVIIAANPTWAWASVEWSGLKMGNKDNLAFGALSIIVFLVVPGLVLGKVSFGSTHHGGFALGSHVVLSTGMAIIMSLSWSQCGVTHGNRAPTCLCLGGHVELSQDGDHLQ